MPVHPLAPDETGTVLNALIVWMPQMHGVGEGGLRSGVVHRLDVDTSGTLLLATKEDAWRRLRDAFRRHETTKRYQAIALGRWSLAEEGQCRLPLVVAQHRPAKVRVAADGHRTDAGVRLCDTRWRVAQRFPNATLLDITLGTGFLHQIRATLSHLSHPLAGDRHYARAGVVDRSGAERPMLHASRLAVGEIDVSCEAPADFMECLRWCRKAPS
jgi:23S rRNA pseudouridine1911/1915/1917 synthase